MATQDIEKGETLTKENIWVKRPGAGDYKSDKYELLLGKKASRKIIKNFQLSKNDLD